MEIIAVVIPGIFAHQRRRPRAHLHAELRLEAIAKDEERLPAVVVGDLDLVLRDVLEVGQLGLVLEQPLGLLADDRPVLLDVPTQGKRSSGKKVASPTSERRADEALDRGEHPFADARSSARRRGPTD